MIRGSTSSGEVIVLVLSSFMNRGSTSSGEVIVLAIDVRLVDQINNGSPSPSILRNTPSTSSTWMPNFINAVFHQALSCKLKTSKMADQQKGRMSQTPRQQCIADHQKKGITSDSGPFEFSCGLLLRLKSKVP